MSITITENDVSMFCMLNDEITNRVEELIVKLGKAIVLFYKEYDYKIIGKEIHVYYRYDDRRTAESMRIPIEYVLDVDRGVAQYQFDRYIRKYLEDIEELTKNKVRTDEAIQKIKKRIEELTMEFNSKNE